MDLTRYTVTGKCNNTMERRALNTSKYKGQGAVVILIDQSTKDPWGHLNFDDLTDDPKYCEGRGNNFLFKV